MFEQAFGLSGPIRIKRKGDAVFVFDKRHQARCKLVDGKVSDCMGCSEGGPVVSIDPAFIAGLLESNK